MIKKELENKSRVQKQTTISGRFHAFWEGAWWMDAIAHYRRKWTSRQITPMPSCNLGERDSFKDDFGWRDRS